MKQKGRRVLSLVTAIVMIAQMLLIALPVTVKAETTSIFTDYLPQITVTTDEAGFTHPGVGLTKELLDNVRTKIRSGAQPWTYYFNSMVLEASEASRTVGSSNSRDGVTPLNDNFDSQGFQGRFIDDAVKAYTQALMYFITGDEVYRANAMIIIRIWEQMDPAKYAYYTDAHIHAGIPLNRMVMAAEILRYTSTQTESLAWTDQDTAKFTNNLIVPVTETLLHSQHHFMNQHNYPIIGAMAGYIFTGNRERYNEAVEWFTVNRTANDQGFNGSVKALFRWVTEEQKPGMIVGEGTPVEPHVQHMEMGRDQAHGGGDLTNAAIITRLIHAQGTKIDPVAGTPSTADNAVGIMEFLNDRILGAANYFWQFMLGYDTPWTPQAYAITGGDPDNVGMGGYIRDTYNTIAHGYWGRFGTANFWDFYSYYTYVKHEDVAQKAPYYYEAFTKKLVPSPGGWRNKDAGNDFWLYLPQEAEADAAKFIPQDQTSGKTLHLEDRYTNLDNNTATMQEGDTRFIRFNATQEGSKIAVLSFAGAAGSGPFGFKIRTNGVTTFDSLGSTFTLPDTKGEWKYVVLAGSFYDIVFMTVKGAPGVTVDIDSVDAAAGTNLTPPVFKAGSSDLKIYSYVGASVNIDLSATDANSTDVIAYEFQNNSKGLPIDAHTGAFSWQPTEAGNYSVVVAATDGTAVSVKNVNIIVSSDRASAVQAIIASYDQNQVYVEATLNNFQTVYNDTLSLINTASEAEFDMQLQALRAAVDGLELVTPLTDFGMPWSKVVAWSTFGKDAYLVNDGDWESGAWFGLAQGSPPHLYHLLDFGPDYKVSATKFGFKSNIFVDRLANSTVYGSNDKMNWTRLTPGVTQYTQAYHTLDVDPAYQNEKYRYIKLEMIKPLPDVLRGNLINLLEMRDFDIYGTRHEIGNKLQSVSLSSDQALNGRVALGNTIKASITAKEAIQNVTVKIQGQDATVSTTDNINWTATATLTGKDQTGDVKVSVDYTKQDGTNGDTVYGTTDGSKLFVADESDLISNVTSLANLIDSTSGRSAADTLTQVNNLFDNDATSGSDFRLNGSGSGSYITFDFKEGNLVTLSSVELLARQGSLSGRINGAVVQGSNDNTTWTTLTKAAVSTPDWQTLSVSGNVPYRYIRIFNGNAWYGNMSEVKFHGKIESVTQIQSASISSPQVIMNRIVPGNTVNVAIVAKEPIKDVKVTIQGQDAVVSSTDNINWMATPTLNQGVEAGPVKFTVNYNRQDGTEGFPATQTTDNTSLYLVDESDVIRDVTSITNLIDSTSGRTAAQTLQQVNYLFDSNASTGSDFRIGNNSGTGSYIIFDFKAGNQATLTSVELLGRTLYDRIRWAVVQGSNDNTTWTTLTTPAVSTPNWQTFEVSSKVPYRYIRIYNGSTWYGNMAEVRFHGAVKAADVTAPVTTDDAPQGSVVIGTTINLNATDDSSGVAATYYTVDGGTQQAGKTVTLNTDGAHTIVYWSVDWAGNEEQRHTLTVNIDDTTPPVEAGLYADITAPTNKDVTVTIYYPLDAAVKEYKVGDNVEWTVYTAPVTVSDNTTVYARSADAAGNISEVASYTVSNIYKTAPSDAIFTADITDPTSGNVTLTISYPDNATVKEYKIGENGTWTAYESPVTVSDNVIVYAQSKDFVGNVSNVTSYTVSNIDRTPPADAVLSADITEPTNQDVTVTVTYPVDAAVKEYKVGETGVWTAYGAPVVISENSMVYARSTDAAGNVSNVTEYAVGNIDRIPPADAILAVDTTVLTNQGVTVMITYPDDAAVKEYKVGDSGLWEAYTEPVVVQENDTVYARGTDVVGNISNVTSTVVSNIWKNAPVTTAALSPAQPTGKNSWYTMDVTVSLSVSADPAGGAVITEYQVNDGEWMVYTGSIPSFGDGVYKLSYRSKDEAGNVEQLKTIEFKVDKTAPVLSVQLDKTSIWPPNHMMVPINATLLSTDDGSGVESVVLTSITSNQPDSGNGDILANFGTAATSFSVRAERGSIYTITYTATDKAGNKTPVSVTVTVPHDQSGI